MKQCWRWFGPNDPIPLSDLHQVGVEGIVTALHQYPPGSVWPTKEIRIRMERLAGNGFTWDVVESLPVSEAIKTQSAETSAHLENYKQSIRNLADCGIRTVCYNFMPILDWTRTQLRAPQAHGGTAMKFTLLEFAVFDLFILERQAASEDYDAAVREIAEQRFREMPNADLKALSDTIVAGLPGANENWTVEDVRARIATYDQIDDRRLRQNLVDFLSEVIPVAEECGVNLCCHPDDPPYALLGLPRVMSSLEDYAYILDALDTQANGATLCTGSLGVAEGFDPVAFVERLGARIHFVHLRNTKRLDGVDPCRPDFFEAPHLEGDTDMVGTIRALMAEQKRRASEGRPDEVIPMRPDHGQDLLSDLQAQGLPGYPLIGRMRGLAELRGIMRAVEGCA